MQDTSYIHFMDMCLPTYRQVETIIYVLTSLPSLPTRLEVAYLTLPQNILILGGKTCQILIGCQGMDLL